MVLLKIQMKTVKLYNSVLYFVYRIGEFCVIRCNDRWYRAECIEARWDGFITVSLIDFGCVYISEICDVREMPQMLAFKSLTVSVTVLPKLDGKNSMHSFVWIRKLSKNVFLFAFRK